MPAARKPANRITIRGNTRVKGAPAPTSRRSIPKPEPVKRAPVKATRDRHVKLDRTAINKTNEIAAEAQRLYDNTAEAVAALTPPGMKAANEAISLVYGDRRGQYGPVEDSMHDIAIGWAVIFKHYRETGVITQRMVTEAFVWTKLARDSFKAKHDNLVDGIGYLLLAAEVSD